MPVIIVLCKFNMHRSMHH